MLPGYLTLFWLLSSLLFLVFNIHIMMTNKKTIYVGNIATTVFGSLFGPIAWGALLYWWLSYHWDTPVFKKDLEYQLRGPEKETE